jgi:hypothetical protein
VASVQSLPWARISPWQGHVLPREAGQSVSRLYLRYTRDHSRWEGEKMCVNPRTRLHERASICHPSRRYLQRFTTSGHPWLQRSRNGSAYKHIRQFVAALGRPGRRSVRLSTQSFLASKPALTRLSGCHLRSRRAGFAPVGQALLNNTNTPERGPDRSSRQIGRFTDSQESQPVRMHRHLIRDAYRERPA